MPGSAGEAAGGRRAATAGSFAIGRPAGSSLSAAAGALFAALAALLVLYPGALSGPFFSDDYILLDKVRDASLGAILAPRALAYGYWRPWSRELHFAALERAFGARPLPFHVVSVALAAAALALFFTLARRLLGTRGAVLAGCGVAALAAWELPVRWPAAAQDLWMLVWGLASLNAFASGRTARACAALALALLSKETAAVLPAIALAWAAAIERLPPARAARRAVPLAAVVLAWLAVHPALGGRWWWGSGVRLPAAVYQSPATAMLRSVLASFNLDAVLRPRIGFLPALGFALPGVALLSSCAAWAARGAPPASGDPPPRSVALFGGAWAVLAWLPLALPFLIWQPYYALMGAMGAWIAIAAGLLRRPWLVVLVVATLALIRVARIETPVREWGDAVLHSEGRRFMERTRAFLALHHPALPAGARLYFGGVPRGMVFVTGAGDAPALRVWYGRGAYGDIWSDYHARLLGRPGADYFFIYDPDRGWREIIAGREDVPASQRADPDWRPDHERLALTFTNAGDSRAAGAEYAKLAFAYPTRADYAYLAGLSAEAAGDPVGALLWYAEAVKRPGADEEMQQRWERARRGAR